MNSVAPVPTAGPRGQRAYGLPPMELAELRRCAVAGWLHHVGCAVLAREVGEAAGITTRQARRDLMELRFRGVAYSARVGRDPLWASRPELVAPILTHHPVSRDVLQWLVDAEDSVTTERLGVLVGFFDREALDALVEDLEAADLIENVATLARPEWVVSERAEACLEAP